MRCSICAQGQTVAGRVTVTLERDVATMVFRDVPALVCDTCGEQYVDAKTTSKLLSQAKTAAQAGVQVEIRAYAAA